MNNPFLYVDIALLALLAVTALAIMRVRNLFAAVLLSTVYSFLSAGLFVALDAVDVALTEAAVGAGVSMVLMLGALILTTRREKVPAHRPLLPLLTVLLTASILFYGLLDVPLFGDAEAPIHQHVAPYYLENTASEIGVPNVVTAVLVSYRGYDTLGETTVIFTAGIGVVLMIGGLFRRKDEEGP
jgi:multicomponent Na+:H+ antiporter subunit B